MRNILSILKTDLLAAQKRHPEVVQQLDSVFLGEGASIRDKGCSLKDVPAQSCLLFMKLSH